VPIGDEPAPAIGVGLRHAHSWAFARRVRARSPRLSVHAALVVCSGALLAAVLAPPPAHAGPTTPSADVADVVVSHGGPPLVLVSQTPWVAPGQSFDLKLRPGSGGAPAARLGVSVEVYSCLSSVSGFDQSLSPSGPSGTPISSTSSPLAVSSLPTVGGGEFDLSMPVETGQAASTTTAGFTIRLASSGGQCQAYPSGVYPVRVQLIDTATSTAVGSITTHLVYTDAAANTQRLRVALALPVHATQPPAPSPSSPQLVARPAAALEQPSAAALAAVAGLVASVYAHQAVPLTLEASGQTVGLLDSPGHQSTLSQLAQLATAPTVHQFASSPFTPVNAAGLVAAGLGGELSLQVARGTQILSADVLHPQGGSAPAGGTLGAWITGDGLDAGTLTTLAAAGYRRVVLPSASVTGSPTNGSTAQPFAVGSNRVPMTALASSADLAARFTGNPGNPVLAAHQLVAELAQLYYEKPNSVTPRAVAVVAPTAWSADPAFADALLGSLDSNPIVEPVTVNTLFDLFPTVASCRTGCRLVAPTGGAGLPAAAIRTQRLRIDEFATAAPTARAVSQQLGDLVLAGETEALRASQQSDVLANTGSAVDAQLSQLAVAGDRSITLTSQRGTVPVAVVSSAPYPVAASLTLTSDKLLFANGTTQWTQPITLRPAYTSIFPVTVRARAPGVFKVDIALRSPGGDLVLSSGQVSVRSTATSVVGIVLSVGAVVVLAVWWIRTSLKRRSKRREDEEREARDDLSVAR